MAVTCIITPQLFLLDKYYHVPVTFESKRVEIYITLNRFQSTMHVLSPIFSKFQKINTCIWMNIQNNIQTSYFETMQNVSWQTRNNINIWWIIWLISYGPYCIGKHFPSTYMLHMICKCNSNNIQDRLHRCGRFVLVTTLRVWWPILNNKGGSNMRKSHQNNDYATNILKLSSS